MEQYFAYIGAAAIALAAGGFHGFGGFGSGLMMAPLLTTLFPATTAVPAVLLLSLASSIRLVPMVRQDVEVRRVVSLAIPAILCLPIGVAALAVLEADLLRRVVSALVLALVVVLFVGVRFRGAGRLRVLVPAGAVSGVLTGVGGVGGPPVVLTFLSLDEPPQVTRANLIAYFACTDIIAVAMQFFSGASELRSVFLLFAVTAPFFLGGLQLGARAFNPGNQSRYRPIALTFLGAVGVFGLLWPG